MTDVAEVKAVADELREYLAKAKDADRLMVSWIATAKENQAQSAECDRKMAAVVSDVVHNQRALSKILGPMKAALLRADKLLTRLEGAGALSPTVEKSL